MQLGVDEGRVRAAVAEKVTDALERLSAAQQMNCQRVSQRMRSAAGVTIPAFSSWRPNQGLILLRSGPWGGRLERKPPDEVTGDAPPAGSPNRFTRRAGQRQSAAAAGLGREDDDLVVRPSMSPNRSALTSHPRRP